MNTSDTPRSSTIPPEMFLAVKMRYLLGHCTFTKYFSTAITIIIKLPNSFECKYV